MEATTIMEWLTTATTTCMTLFTNVLTTITDTPALALIFAGTCIIPIGFGLFSRFRNAAG